MKRTLTKKEQLELQIKFYEIELMKLQEKLIEAQKELEKEQKLIRQLIVTK